jgi:hypothetical protein
VKPGLRPMARMANARSCRNRSMPAELQWVCQRIETKFPELAGAGCPPPGGSVRYRVTRRALRVLKNSSRTLPSGVSSDLPRDRREAPDSPRPRGWGPAALMHSNVELEGRSYRPMD